MAALKSAALRNVRGRGAARDKEYRGLGKDVAAVERSINRGALSVGGHVLLLTSNVGKPPYKNQASTNFKGWLH